MNLFLPGHELSEPLRHSPEQQRSVWRSNVDGRPCVTRILHVPVDPALEVVIRRAALEGRGQLGGLHRDLASVLEGYQTLASLQDLPGVPEIVAAGLALDAADPTVGYPYLSLSWAEGEPLDAMLARGVAPQALDALLLELLELLGALHARGVAFGDVKPSNFVRAPDGTLRLIDPDTLRRVPAAPGYVRVHDRTPGWAAPELMEPEPLLWLQSDLYGLGLIVCQGFAGSRPGEPGFDGTRLPARWRGVVERCLRRDPRERPGAAELIAALRGVEVPIPVPTPQIAALDATIRVPEPVVAPPAPPPARPRSRLRLLVGGALGAGLLLAASGGTWALVRRGDADRATARVWRDLRVYKTEWKQNTDANLDAIARGAAEAVSLWPTPDALGLAALVRVWDERWHYVAKARPWDPQAYAATERQVEEALAAGATLGALSARGVLLAGACRKMPEDAGITRVRRCEDALLTLEQAEDQASAEPWLALELRWNRIMALSSLSQLSEPSRASTLRAQGLALCASARPRLDEAPVNGGYLASDCLELAGATDDVPEYLAWADWILDRAEAQGAEGGSQARVARQIVRATHPDCAELPLRRDGLPDLRASRCEGGREDLCRALALAALGCEVPLWRACVQADPALPWDAVDTALDAPLRSPCPGAYELGDLPASAIRGAWQSWAGSLFGVTVE